MNRYRTVFSTLLVASCLAGFAVPAAAAPDQCWSNGDRNSYFEHRGERMERHHKKVLQALKLSPEQEVAWKKFVAADGSMSVDRPTPKSDEWVKLSSPERADKMLELIKERQARMTEHVAALKEFYAVLTTEQKRAFDELHVASGRGMHRKHGHRMGMDKGTTKQ